jgi:pentatricopeptide repeat protein
MLQDRYGLDVSTDSDVARDAYVAGTDAMLAATEDSRAELEKAIAADPQFALPRAALAREHQLNGRAKEARAAAEHAEELAANATERERQHIEIFKRMVTGKAPDALDLTRQHLQSWSRDAFVLSPSCGVFGLIGFSGRVGREPEQLALLEPLVADYGDDWWFLSAYAFALLEMGQWARARDLILRSLEQFPRNAHAAHIYAHALYEGGEDKASHAYLEEWMPAYHRNGLLHCHLSWHQCLMRMVNGDVDGTWAIFDANCAPGTSTSPAINVMSDGASLLWRSEIAGHPRSEQRWEQLRDYTQQMFPKPMVFIDAHGGLPYAALGDQAGLERHIELIHELAEKGRLPAGTVGADLSAAFGAYANGDWASTIGTLEGVMDQVVRIGGSRAQRDLINNTLLAAYIKDGRPEAAHAMVDRMTDRSPSIAVAGLN